MAHSERTIVIIGAGSAGLSLGYHLKLPYRIFERDLQVGGLCRSPQLAGCTFDYAPRVMLPGSAYATELGCKLLEDNVAFLPFGDWSYHPEHQVYTRFPLQKHLYGLPADTILHYLTGLVTAADQFATRSCEAVANYRDWLYRSVGQPLADGVIIPQETKKWKTDIALLDHRWAPRRVAQPDLETALRGATQDIVYDRKFGYPRAGGIAALMHATAWHVTNLYLGSSLQAVDTQQRVAHFQDGGAQPYQALVSTIPLPRLVGMLDQVPEEVQAATDQLEHVALQCVCFVVRREQVSEKHFVYVHDPDIIFHRVSFLSNLSPHMAPPGYSSIVAEVSYLDQPAMDDPALLQRVWADLLQMEVVRPDDELTAGQVFTLPYAYPKPNVGWLDQVRLVRAYLEEQDIYLLGRFGEWEYLNIHDNVERGRDLAVVLAERYG